MSRREHSKEDGRDSSRSSADQSGISELLQFMMAENKRRDDETRRRETEERDRREREDRKGKIVEGKRNNREGRNSGGSR